MEKTRRKSAGGRQARIASRREAEQKNRLDAPPYIVRRIAPFDYFTVQQIETLERNADYILEKIGIEFTNDEEILDLFPLGRGAH